jgi:hypothetical protein
VGEYIQTCLACQQDKVDTIMQVSIVTPSHLGVTRGDHVSWPAMRMVIPTIIMIDMSTNINNTILQMLIPHQHITSHSINKAHWDMVAQHIIRYVSPYFT